MWSGLVGAVAIFVCCFAATEFTLRRKVQRSSRRRSFVTEGPAIGDDGVSPASTNRFRQNPDSYCRGG
jgi:hypothetical protein